MVLDCIEHTHSLSEFINMGQSITRLDYIKFILEDKHGDYGYMVHNVLDDYLDDLKDNAIWVKLTEKQVLDYRYNPKKLSFKLYETTLFHHIILKVNDMCNVHDFSLESGRLRLIPVDLMNDILTEIYSHEKTTIMNYNNTHSNLESPNSVSNDRLSGTV
jgi:hypothetical protein